jgi:hypothetical protein
MADQPDASMIEDESLPGAQERFLSELNKNVSLRELARLMADGMDPDEAYDIVLAQSKVKKDE